MNKNKLISIGFISLAILLGIAINFLGNSTFVIGIFCLVMYVYHSFLIAPNQRRFLNIKKALKSSYFSNEELSKIGFESISWTHFSRDGFGVSIEKWT